MYSYGGHQTYTTYQQPTYTYYTRPAAYNTSYTYTTSSSPPRGSRTTDYNYAYTKPPAYTYTQYDYDYDYDEPRSRQHQASFAERMRRNDRRHDNDYYYPRRASPERRDQHQYRKEDVYGYDYSPRGSPPPPYQDDDSEYEVMRHADRRRKVDVYEEDVKGTKYKTYTFTKAEKTTSAEKKEGAIPKRTTSTRSKAPKQPTTSNPKPTPSSKSKFRTSFFNFSSSKPSKPQTQFQPKSAPPPKAQPQPHAHFSSSPKAPRTATAADAATHSIPPGYSLKNWDPTLRPLILLGSVFDANSLGKWIYDWTVYTYTAHSVFADIAAELWLSLIGLAGRCQRGERWIVKAAGRKARAEDVKLVDDFLVASERLWTRLEGILEACEAWMYRAARREGRRVDERTGRVLEMGRESGVEFVESVFGREREAENTEMLCAAVRLWTKRYDSNCERIVSRG